MRPIAALLLGVLALPATAGEGAWPDLRATLFGDRVVLDAPDLVVLAHPGRSENDGRTVLGADVTAPPERGIVAVTLILDENPMPVSAVLRFAEPQPHVRFDGTFRVNGPTPLHVVAEMQDGGLLGAEGFVKTSGLGACAAPPGTDPVAALATLGEMAVAFSAPGEAGGDAGAAGGLAKLDALRRHEVGLDLGISHPSHSGMQMDQVTLLFTPMRYVETLEVALDGQPHVTVTGSISLSENPELHLSVPGATRRADVTLTDTDGTRTEASASRADY